MRYTLERVVARQFVVDEENWTVGGADFLLFAFVMTQILE